MVMQCMRVLPHSQMIEVDFREIHLEPPSQATGASLPGLTRNTIERVGDTNHLRFVLDGESARVQCESYTPSPLWAITLLKGEYFSPARAQVIGSEMFRIRLGRQGRGHYIGAGGERTDFDGLSLSIFLEPAGMPPALAECTGVHESAHLSIHRDALRALYGESLHELATPLRAFIEGTLDRTYQFSAPLSAALVVALHDTLECTLEGRSRSLHLHANSMRILSLTVDMLHKTITEPGLDVRSEKMRRAVHKAQSILIEEHTPPPSIETLARQVGLSRSSLCAGFRAINGKSIHAYGTDLRMQRALQLLGAPSATVTEVAYELGYNHPSSFSAAMQNYFGTPPSDLIGRAAERLREA